VPPDGGEDLLRPRRQVRVGVDLPVRVREGHPDLLSVVLEAEDVLDPGDRAQRLGPLRPDVDHQPCASGPQLGEDPVVVAGEDHDLAPAEPGAQSSRAATGHRRPDVAVDRGGQRREPVLEDDDLVVGLGDLGRVPWPRGVEGALVGRGEERARLPVRGDGHPLVEQHVVTQLGTGADRRQVAGVHGVARLGAPVVVEVEDLPAVGQSTTRPDHVAPASPPPVTVRERLPDASPADAPETSRSLFRSGRGARLVVVGERGEAAHGRAAGPGAARAPDQVTGGSRTL
jgi:hypothetical protein